MDFMVFMAKMFVFFFPGVLTGLGLAHCRNRGQRNRREAWNRRAGEEEQHETD